MTKAWLAPAVRGMGVLMMLVLWHPHTPAALAVATVATLAALVPDRVVARVRSRQVLARAARAQRPELTPAQRAYERGFGLLRAGRHAEAAQELRAAAEAAPADADARRYLSEALVKTGAPDEAERAIRECIALRPRDPDAHLRLGLVLAELGEIFSAARALQEALRLDPRHAEARRALDGLRPAPAAAVAATGGRAPRSRSSAPRGSARTAPSPAA